MIYELKVKKEKDSQTINYTVKNSIMRMLIV